MKRIVNKFVVFFVILATVCCLCVTAGCATKVPADYTIIVYNADGTPVDGTKDGTKGPDENEVWIQFCSKENGTCNEPLTLGKDGKLTISKDKIFVGGDGVYELHILGIPESAYPSSSYVTVNSADSPKEIKITLKTTISK